jgi:glycosyltransferase involved in cell wall biosynthesis
LPYQKLTDRIQEITAEGQLWVKREKILVDLSDVTTAVSEVDAQHFRANAKHPERIKIFPNVVDLEYYSNTPTLPDNYVKPCIYLAGTFYGTNSPMENGARWFIEKVFPLVLKKIPNVHFYIVGKESDYILRDVKASNITITGGLISVLPYMNYADVAIVPLKFESGTRFKILEAGAAALPVVSTTLGAEGLSVSSGKDILIADAPEEFADCLIKILTDSKFAAEIGNNLKKLVQEHYSIQSLANKGSEILNFLT